MRSSPPPSCRSVDDNAGDGAPHGKVTGALVAAVAAARKTKKSLESGTMSRNSHRKTGDNQKGPPGTYLSLVEHGFSLFLSQEEPSCDII